MSRTKKDGRRTIAQLIEELSALRRRLAKPSTDNADHIEEALRESEAKLRAQYRGIPIPVYTWQKRGGDLVLTGYNDAAHRFTRGGVAQFVGARASEMYRASPEILVELSRCADEAVPIERTMPYTLRTTGETKILAVKYAFVPPDMVLVHTEDITERTCAEEALRQSEERLRSIIASMDDLVFVLDREQCFVEFYQPSRRSTLYASPEEFLGKKIGDVLPSEVAESAQRAIEAVIATGEVQLFDYSMEISGEERWYSANVSAIRDDNGEYAGITAVVRDISQRKRAEQELQAAHANLERRVEERTRELLGLRRQAEQLAAMRERERLARDLHDAVTQTLFSVSLIADALPSVWERDADEGRQRLEEMRRMTRGALAEMRELLLELRPAALADTELGDLLRQLTESMGGRAGLTTEVEIEGSAPVHPELKLALYRIAQEALNNVAKHAATGSARVELRCLPGRVGLKIEDDGRGFDPQRIPPASMGLRIMRERAEAVGAELRIGSRSGQGSWVQVEWIAADDAKD